MCILIWENLEILGCLTPPVKIKKKLMKIFFKLWKMWSEYLTLIALRKKTLMKTIWFGVCIWDFGLTWDEVINPHTHTNYLQYEHHSQCMPTFLYVIKLFVSCMPSNQDTYTAVSLSHLSKIWKTTLLRCIYKKVKQITQAMQLK